MRSYSASRVLLGILTIAILGILTTKVWQAAEKLQFDSVLGSARLHSLRKNSYRDGAYPVSGCLRVLGPPGFGKGTTSEAAEKLDVALALVVLRLLLGGTALQRCDSCLVLNPASAAEVTTLAQERLFPHPLQSCRYVFRNGPRLRFCLVHSRRLFRSLLVLSKIRTPSLLDPFAIPLRQ